MKSLKHLALRNLSNQNVTYNEEVSSVLDLVINSEAADNDRPNFNDINITDYFQMKDGKLNYHKIVCDGGSEKEFVNGVKVKKTYYRDFGRRHKIQERFYSNNKLHRIQEWHNNGQLIFEKWFNTKGEEHKLDGAAKQTWYENGQKESEIWYVNGKRHRLDGPAEKMWNCDGRARCEYWYVDGQLHSLGGPSLQCWDENGQKYKEEWHNHGLSHRLNNPAHQGWYENGQKSYEVWYNNGKAYRLDGPSYQRWCKDGRKDHEAYYEDGICIHVK